MAASRDRGYWGRLFRRRTSHLATDFTVAQELSMRVAGQQRTYILARPNASGPLPTFIFLHGKGGSGAKAQRMGFEQLGEREQFVTVLPDGLGGEWNVFPPGFRDRTGRFTNGADTAFIKQLIGDLVHHGIADPNRVYLAGISNGALMASAHGLRRTRIVCGNRRNFGLYARLRRSDL